MDAAELRNLLSESLDKESLDFMEENGMLADFAKDLPHDKASKEDIKKVMTDAMQNITKDVSQTEASEIQKLPIEDTLWVIGRVWDPNIEPEDVEKDVHPANRKLWTLTIIDAKGTFIGTSMADETKDDIKQVVTTMLLKALLHPMIGKPRRPRYLEFRKQMAMFEGLDVSCYGIELLNDGDLSKEPPCGCQVPTRSRRKTCVTCQRRGEEEMFYKCSSCKCLYYCTAQCQRKDWKGKKGSSHSHKFWCPQMKQFMAADTELCDVPFTFASRTTSDEFDSDKMRDYLEGCGVFNQGYWIREYQPCCDNGLPNHGGIGQDDNPYILPVEASILENDTLPSSPSVPLKTWADYYEWRGLKLDSPIAVLMQWPLTLYNLLVNCLPQDYPSTTLTDQISIHILGAEKEVDIYKVFFELGVLMPNNQFDIHLVGPNMVPEADGRVYKHRNVSVSVHKSVYHSTPLGIPTLAVCFNAGLPAYATWTETLKKLKSDSVPVYVTDYCQYACVCSSGLIQYVGGSMSDIRINSFRSPFRKYCFEHNMPWFSNAFFFAVHLGPGRLVPHAV